MKNPNEIQAQLSATSAQLDAARRMVIEGRNIDLGDLRGRVEKICAAIAKLAAPKRKQFTGQMVSLIDELDKLASELIRHHETLAKGLKAVSARQQATSAYGRATRTERG